MELRLDARLTSGLAYLISTTALFLSLFWYSPDRLVWIYGGAAALLAMLAVAYMLRSRFVVVHALHALLLLLVEMLWFLYAPAALDWAYILLVLVFFGSS